MSNAILWSLAIIGGLGAIVAAGVIVLALIADNAQRNGNNWFR